LSSMETSSARTRSAAGLRVLIGLLLLLLGGAALHACVIEERPFNEQLAGCDEYCREMANSCTGEYAVYESTEQCLAVCAQIPPGSADELTGTNTLSCRLDRLRADGFEAVSRCPAAGPGGDGICGDNCESFCALRRQACGELQPTESDIARENFCETSCPGLADPPGFSITTHAVTDTLQCRMIQLARALAAPETALDGCAQSRIVPRNSESVCSDDASLPIEQDRQTYCNLVMTSCTGENQVYENVQQCLDTSSTFEPGLHGDQDLNTLRCRRYHAYAALNLASEHCPHAGPTGDGHCGQRPVANDGNCTSYCRILEVACRDEYTERFSSGEAGLGNCLSTCTGLPDAVANGFAVPPRYTTAVEPAPETLKCRTLHAMRAFETPDECAAAFADPGSDCD
jgi:hypothetical protein